MGAKTEEIIQVFTAAVFFALALTRQTQTVLTKLNATGLERMTELFGALTVTLAVYHFVGYSLEVEDMEFHFFNSPKYDQKYLHWGSWVAGGAFMGFSNRLANFCPFMGMFSLKGVHNLTQWLAIPIFLVSTNFAIYVLYEIDEEGEYWGDEFTETWKWIAVALYGLMGFFILFNKTKHGLGSPGHLGVGILFGLGFVAGAQQIIQVVQRGLYFFKDNFLYMFLVTWAVAMILALLFAKFANQSQDTIPPVHVTFDIQFFFVTAMAGISMGITGANFYSAAMRLFTCCHLILYWLGFVGGAIVGNAFSPVFIGSKPQRPVLENVI